MQKSKHLLAKCVTFTFTILLLVGYVSVPVNGYPSNTFRDLDICNHWNGRRHFLELGERGDLHARNVTTSAFRSTLFSPTNPSQMKNRSSTDIWYQCNLELVTCAECVIRITFIHVNFSKTCERIANSGIGKSSLCPCEHIQFSEPPYDTTLSGQEFCGDGKVFRSKTRTLLLKFFYRATNSHVFSLQYFSERNVKIVSGSPRQAIISNYSKNEPHVISTPYFPMPYPRDYGIEHILTCESENCQVRLDFTDFQLGLTSTLEIFDSNGQMLDSYTGEHFRPPITISNGKSLLLQFRGNGNTGVGFRGEITFVSSKQLKEDRLVPYTDGIRILTEISEITKKRVRSCSVREINRKRRKDGFFVRFLEMKRIDHADFFIYTRMTPQVYGLLLTLVEPFLKKNSLREPVQPECRLALTLQYLSQGTSFQSLAWSFQLGKETVRRIILETAEVLWTKLGAVYVSEPNEEDFKQISQDFWELWNMPNCVGSIDGKHIAIRCPPKSGSQFFCYKKFFSIVLLAVCDARYRFTYIDIGAYGSQSDGGIFQVSRLGKRLLDHKLPIPPAKNLPNTQLKTPHFFVGDAAFPLGTNLMRPYPGGMLPNEKEVFNKRLSRARRTIENSFGILVARWRVLLTTLHLFPENAEKIVLACVALHNFIMFNNVNASSYIASNYADWEDSNGDFHDGLWRREVESNIPSIMQSSNLHHYGGRSSLEIRNNLCSFFNTF